MTLPKLSENPTIGETLGFAMKITNQEQADAWFEILVQDGIKRRGDLLEKFKDNENPASRVRFEIEKIIRGNLGYYAGYYDHETRARVERLFKCSHPIFGSIEENGPPSAAEALKKGLELGSKHLTGD